MNEPDYEMEAALEKLARQSPTPALPPELESLPWTVQRHDEVPRLALLPFAGRLSLGLGRLGWAAARLGAVVILGGALLLMATRIHSSGPAANQVVPPPSPRPTPVLPAQSGHEVVVLPTSGVVDDVMADYVKNGIAKAESDGAAAVIVELNTLGGSGDAMSRIVGYLHASIPTIVWVGPAGAEAGSAGAFIAMAGNLAYMAPSTNIGAASPVSQNGGDIASQYGQTEADKVLNNAVKQMGSIVQERHPQAVAWAETMVSSAQSYTAEEALAAGGIDGIAVSLDDVLNAAEGKTVTVDGASVVVETAGASIVTINEDPIQTILHTLDDPNIAFILLVIGVLCIIIEFFHPTILVGLLGAASLILSFYGSGNLPLNIVGVLLVVLGIVMLALEPAIPSHGLLTLGGLAAFIVGAVAFYGTPGPFLPGVSVAWPIILTMGILSALYSTFLLTAIMRLRRMPLPEGTGMVGTVKVMGMEGKVQAALVPTGTVHVARESWSAREANNDQLPRGTKVRVVGQEGLTLIVEKVE